MNDRPIVEQRKNRRFREAYKYVSRGWLPYNPEVLKLVRHRFGDGTYKADQSRLYQDIGPDIGLTAFLLRRMAAVVSPEHRALPPIEVIERTPLEKLSEIFHTSDNEISNHDFSGIKEVQTIRLRHLLISSAAAQTLANETGVSADLAHLGAIFRQVGTALVAWNYPSTVAKAETALAGSEKSFEFEIGAILGFDPRLLGAEVLLEWCQNKEMVGVVDPAASFDSEGIDAASRELMESLRLYCELGEGLARAHDVEHYPNAIKDWKKMEGRVTHILGTRGLQLIQARMNELFPFYMGLSPKALGKELSPEKSAQVISEQHSKKLLAANDYLRKCPEDIRTAFQRVYEVVAQGEISLTAVNRLIGEVIPQAGFITGCVYFLDPTRMILVPRLKIGNVEIKNFRPVSCSCGGARSNPIAEAFHCNTPICGDNVIVNGGVASHITGRFGSQDRIAVLHLEFTNQVKRDPHERLLAFKAIRHALGDSLNFR